MESGEAFVDDELTKWWDACGSRIHQPPVTEASVPPLRLETGQEPDVIVSDVLARIKDIEVRQHAESLAFTKC